MSVEAKRVDDFFDSDEGRRPGAFKFFTVDGKRAGFNFRCPCGACEHIGGVRFSPPSSTAGWTWAGNLEAPTIHPSVDLNNGHWHGWLRAGKWESC